jgi:hypothetical protein
MALTEPQIRRYSRHVLLPDVGGTGQSRLLAATVLVDLAVDTPAATVAATYLAAAGVGTLVLTPPDPALSARLSALNPDVRFPDTPDAEGTWHLGATYPGATYPGATYPGATYPGATYLQADALVRGGAAACEVIWRIVRGDA